MAGGNNTVGTPGDFDLFRQTTGNEIWPSQTILFWQETRNGEVQPYQRIENIPNELHAEELLIQQLSEHKNVETVRLLINYSPCGDDGERGKNCAKKIIDFLESQGSIKFDIYFVKRYKNDSPENQLAFQSLEDHEHVSIQEFSEREWEELATLTGQ